MLPPLWICRHHVDVALKQQRSGYAVAGQPGYEIGAAINFGQDLVLDAGVVQQALMCSMYWTSLPGGLVVSKRTRL